MTGADATEMMGKGCWEEKRTVGEERDRDVRMMKRGDGAERKEERK